MSFKHLFYQVLLWRGAYLFSTFLLNLLFARYYGASASSTVYYLINLYAFVLLIGSLSVESGMGFFLAKQEVGAGALYTFSLLWTVVMSALCLLLLKIYFHYLDKEMVTGTLFWVTAATYIPGQLLITFFSALFYARQAAVLSNKILLIVNGVMILLLLVTDIAPAVIGPVQYLYIYFLGILAQGILLVAWFRRKYVRTEMLSLPDRALLKKIYNYSLVAFTANIIFFLVYRMDYWFVKRFCTAGELGNYIQVSKLGQMLLVIPGIMASVVFPSTALRTTEEMPSYLARMTRLAVLFFILLFLIIFFTGKWLFPLLFGDSFDKMYLPTLLVLPGILFLFILAPLSAYFGGLHRPGVNAKGALAGVILMVAGDILFIPRYKIAGAAAVSSAGYFVCMLYSLLQFSKHHRISLMSMILLKKEDWRWLRRQVGNIHS
ncbi:MAG: polysaccharide biosynthesis C-terminal domain-containing protein [Chitinophagaceae bacterium]|nr:polysaccharide biosynthesis C-terminal domain-containing protein [Chitinophagaceae bacterium]